MEVSWKRRGQYFSSRLRQRSLSRPRFARSSAARIRSRVLRLALPPSGREIRRGTLIEEGEAVNSDKGRKLEAREAAPAESAGIPRPTPPPPLSFTCTWIFLT
ncbi:hypothetical protein CapIbe_000888 [Capra ibex]